MYKVPGRRSGFDESSPKLRIPFRTMYSPESNRCQPGVPVGRPRHGRKLRLVMALGKVPFDYSRQSRFPASNGLQSGSAGSRLAAQRSVGPAAVSVAPSGASSHPPANYLSPSPSIASAGPSRPPHLVSATLNSYRAARATPRGCNQFSYRPVCVASQVVLASRRPLKA